MRSFREWLGRSRSEPRETAGAPAADLPLSYARTLSWLSLVVILLTSLGLSFFMSNSARQTLLTKQEEFARLLADKGFAILARNWRQGRLELDLVCRDGGTLVFVEVKSRRGDGLARPEDAMTPRKRRTLVRAARAWLAATEAWSSPCRFDVVTVTACGPNSLHLEHIPHAFALDDAGAAVDRGHAPWQPW